jgi:thiol-disulfide isomerase/thioredoxin
MKIKISLLCLFLLTFSNNSSSQDWKSQEWVVSLIEKKSDSGKTNEKFPKNLEMEMKKFVGLKAQHISFQPIENPSFFDSLESYKGHVIIIQFGGTSCSGCKMQMPELSRIQKIYNKQGVKVIFLFPEPRETLKKEFEGNTFSGMIAALDRTNISKPFQTIAMPTAYILDVNGIIRDCWVAPEKFGQIEKRLKPYLAQTK